MRLSQPIRAGLCEFRPETPDQLHAWLRLALGIDVPRAPLDEGSSAPFDYLCHAFFEPPRDAPDVRDLVVWACRGGGKTFYAALATALDLLFKPGIEIKILGGSLEQSQRMHHHLRAILLRPELARFLDGPVTVRGLRLRSGSSAEVLAQSHTSVRGARPQKLRCDEVELFHPEVWNAAQLVTRSAWCGSTFVHGAIEALSTMHAPHGLMADLVTGAGVDGASRRLVRWGVTDVLEACPESRPCDGCNLWDECRGRAKSMARGHVRIDDAIAQKLRVDRQTWDAEMRCLRPSRRDAVFPEFDPDVHLLAPGAHDRQLGGAWRCVVGMDFGFRAPTVILWAGLDNDNVLRIIDECIRSETLLEAHIQAILGGGPRRFPCPAWVACDPAGNQRSAQSGASDVTQLRRAGLVVRSPRFGIERGVSAVRARIAPASGSPTLLIHPRCTGLIDALRRYHYDPRRLHDAAPVKDGPDHAIDALRYLVTSIDLQRPPSVHDYR